LNGRKILVVEDNAFNQLVAVKFLEKWNVEVDVAENGLIALDKIKTHFYDLILMDIQMPEMNGIEATVAIRNMEDEQLKNIPIIAFTAAADSESEKLIAQGMNDCVSKPFNPTELFNKILQHI
jgi:CheY-like chemotaxis protein